MKHNKIARYLGILVVSSICVVLWVPSALAVPDLFVGNFFGETDDVLRFNGTTGAFLGTFVPTGSGGLTFPLGGTFGPDGNLYVSNSNADDVLRYNRTTGAFLSTFASSVGDAAGLSFGPDSNLYVANASTPGSVTKLNGTTGALITAFGSGQLLDPEGLTFGPDHNLYVANVDGNDVLRYNATTGTFIDSFVAAGSGGLAAPRDVIFGPDGNLYVTSFGTNAVLRYNGTTGAFLDAFVPAGSGGLSLPRDLLFGPDGNLYVGSFASGDILRYNGNTGAFIDTFVAAGSGGLGGPTFLAFEDISAPTSVPEPATLVLLGGALAGMVVARRKTIRGTSGRATI